LNNSLFVCIYADLFFVKFVSHTYPQNFSPKKCFVFLPQYTSISAINQSINQSPETSHLS